MSIMTEKFMLNLDKNRTKLLNLTILQRMDPHIEDILNTSTHVTSYKFNADLNQWSRKDVEGPLFVVKRNTQPRFQFVVMNTRNTGNLIEDLLGDFQYDVQTPYLLYRNSSEEVNGIWFYNSQECYEVACVFNRILSAYSKVAPKENISSSKREFEELEEVLTTSSIGGSLKPSFAHLSTADVVNFFSVIVEVLFINVVFNEYDFTGFLGVVLDIGEAALVEKHGCLFVLDALDWSCWATAVNIGQNTRAVSSSGSSSGSTSGSTSGSSSDSDSDSGSPYHVPAHPLPSNAAVLMPFPSSAIQVSSLPIMSSTSPMPFIENQGLINSNRIVNLVKPSSFIAPDTSSSAPLPVSTAFHHVPNLNRSHGTPFLQPSPPPKLPLSFTSGSSTSLNHTDISRDTVRDALLILVQDNQFIDMFYQALLKVHHQP